MQAVKVITRWLGGRRWTLLGDGICVRAMAPMSVSLRGHLISRLRLDAHCMRSRPATPAPPWSQTVEETATVLKRESGALASPRTWRPRYGGTTRRVRVLGGTSLWYTPGARPVAIRWVLIVDPSGKTEPMAVLPTWTSRWR